MDSIMQYRALCKLLSPLSPFEKPSPTQILFTKQKIRLMVEKKGGNPGNIQIISVIGNYDDLVKE
jgi:hypothetical protein